MGPGRTASTSLEWHDLDAAVAYAVDIHSLALVSQSDAGARRTYDLVSITDAPVRIEFVASGLDGAPARPDIEGPVDITVRVGVFGDEATEGAILATLRDRLAWLRERD